MPNEMTAAEAAEMLEDIAAVSDLKAVDGKRSGVVKIGRVDAEDLRIAASYLRAIAAGEYKRVVHGRLKEDCLNDSSYCPVCGKRAHRTYACCPYCGCWFDGKDDSHVKKRSTHDTLY